MPGIVGLMTQKPRDWAEPQLARMVESMRHESFYVTGTWSDESLGSLCRLGGAEEILLGCNACSK